MKEATLSVYGRRGDPGAIALAIARAIPGSDLTHRGKTHRVSVASKRTLFRQIQPELVVEVDPSRFASARAEQQRTLVHQQIVRRMRGPGLESVLAMIPEVRLAVSFVHSDPHHSIGPGDPLFQVVLDVAARVDGFVLDLPNGRLFSTTGQLWGSTEHFLVDGGTPVDLSLDRVQWRLVALVAVAARALTEYDGRDLNQARDGITDWVRACGASTELEELEQAMLIRPPASMDGTELAHWSWQIEGAVVLAWTLDLIDELPAFDEAVDPTLLSAVLRFPDSDRTDAVLRSGRRRHQAIIDSEAERHSAIYWRLTQFAAHHEALDLETFTHDTPSGPVRFDNVPLIGGDLAVGGRPVKYADPDTLDVVLGITSERLRALNWLRRGGIYSETKLAR